MKPIICDVNLTVLQWLFPQCFGIPLVYVIYKTKDPMYCNNYRPVLVLSTLAKMHEILMHNRIIDSCKYSIILHNYQSGFGNNQAAYRAFIILLETLMKALENGAIRIFINFQMHFATILHGLPVSFKQMTMCTKVMNVSVNTSAVVYHKVLAYVHFICISGFSPVSNVFMPILFADAINLFCTSHNVNPLADKISWELGLVQYKDVIIPV